MSANEKPGEMHPVNEAFYRLTVAQRDAAWREIEGLRADLARVERERDELRVTYDNLTDAVHRAWAERDTALASAQGMRAALERWQAFSRHLFGPCVICWDENAEGLCTEAQELLGLEIHRTAAGSQIQNYATIQEMTNRALTATPPAAAGASEPAGT